MKRSDVTVAAAALDLDVLVEERAWTEALPDVAELCRVAALAAYTRAARHRHLFGESAQACLLLADDARVRRLNRDFRGRDQPTDVLSFPSVAPDVLAAAGTAVPPPILGDIVVAYETSAADAAREGTALGDHLRHLVVHAILHLMGYDHESEAEAAEMEFLEVGILAALGVADPYASAGGR